MSYNLWRFERPKRSKRNHKYSWKRHFRNQRKRIARWEFEEWQRQRDSRTSRRYR